MDEPTTMLLGDMSYSNAHNVEERINKYFTRKNLKYMTLSFNCLLYHLCIIPARNFPNFSYRVSPLVKYFIVLIPEYHTLSAISYFVFNRVYEESGPPTCGLRESGQDFLFPLVALTDVNDDMYGTRILNTLKGIKMEGLPMVFSQNYNSPRFPPRRNNIDKMLISRPEIARYSINELIMENCFLHKGKIISTDIKTKKIENVSQQEQEQKQQQEQQQEDDRSSFDLTYPKPTHRIALFGTDLQEVVREISSKIDKSFQVYGSKYSLDFNIDDEHPKYVTFAFVHLTDMDYNYIKEGSDWTHRCKSNITNHHVSALIVENISELSVFGKNTLVYKLDINMGLRSVVLRLLSDMLSRNVESFDERLIPHVTLCKMGDGNMNNRIAINHLRDVLGELNNQFVNYYNNSEKAIDGTNILSRRIAFNGILLAPIKQNQSDESFNAVYVNF